MIRFLAREPEPHSRFTERGHDRGIVNYVIDNDVAVITHPSAAV
jgi:hypothetical protein